eukprot:jgi/Ulvmu1/6755/UM030_0090.1
MTIQVWLPCRAAALSIVQELVVLIAPNLFANVFGGRFATGFMLATYVWAVTVRAQRAGLKSVAEAARGGVGEHARVPPVVLRPRSVDDVRSNTLTGTIKSSAILGQDPLDVPAEAGDAVVATAFSSVQDTVLPAWSCPGELVAAVDAGDGSAFGESGLQEWEPTVVRRVSAVGESPAVRLQSALSGAGGHGPVRERTQSVIATDSRQLSYSLREVPMFTSTYSWPERSNNCDQRKVDVWAAGCILYELCTGKPFIKASTERERFVMMAQFYDPNWQPPKLPTLMSCWQPRAAGSARH